MLPSNSIVGYLEFATLYKAFRFLDETPILRLSKACRPALGIGSEEGVLPRMWNELTGSATTHFDMVIDMMNGERMDGWMGETGKPKGEMGIEMGDCKGEMEKLGGEMEKPNGEMGDCKGETEKPNGKMGDSHGETEKLPEEALESSEETWKSMEETSALLVESMQNRLKATKEADWRWIEFC